MLLATTKSIRTFQQQRRHALIRAAQRDRQKRTTLETDFDMETVQRNDNDLQPVIEALERDPVIPPWETLLHLSEDSKNSFVQWPSLILHGVLFRKYVDAKKQLLHLQCVIPHNVRNFVLHQIHAGFTSGHYGVRKKLILLSQRAYWKGWRKDCERYVRKCSDCAAYHRGRPPRQGELQDMIVGAPMERAGIDLTGPWPRSNGNVYILMFIDHFETW
jgi:Integrase zinc binding domain